MPFMKSGQTWEARRRFKPPRVKLRSYTVPSLDAQTDQNFVWLVGVDEDVPDIFHRALREVLGDRAEVITVSEGSNFNSMVTDQLLRFGDHSITVRLDSDDALNRTFVACLRGRCKEIDVVYNSPHGLGFFEQWGTVVRKWIKSSLFISKLWEPGAHFLTLGLHSVVDQKAILREVPTLFPMYLKTYSTEMTSNFPQNGWATCGSPRRLLLRGFGVVRGSSSLAHFRERARFFFSYIGRKLGVTLPLVKKMWMFTRKLTIQ